MAVIKVPKTPKRAFNPNRPPSGLLRAQVEHLEAAAATVQGVVRHRKVRTEGQAAQYIQQLTAQLYPHDVPVPDDGSRGIAPPPAPRRAAAPTRRTVKQAKKVVKAKRATKAKGATKAKKATRTTARRPTTRAASTRKVR